VLPGPLRRKMDIRAGDPLDISIERDRIVLTTPKRKHSTARIIEDPITSLPVIDAGSDAPVLTSKTVRELLVDFP
jgi:hypothetical protein